jgi:phospholipase C
MSGFRRLKLVIEAMAIALAAVVSVQGRAIAASGASSGLNRVAHILILIQENHSFDSYLGVLPYQSRGSYHPPKTVGGPCDPSDHRCVDGLTCKRKRGGKVTCSNSNPGTDNQSLVKVFHLSQYCAPSPKHDWVSMHTEANWNDPNSTLMLADGFVRTNAGDETTMGYYTRQDLPYYYALARKFAISDRAFSSLLGPTLPNRMYVFAATSFGHNSTTAAENMSPPGGYKPIDGTIFDLLDGSGVSWAEYYQAGDGTTPPLPYGQMFRDPSDPHFLPLAEYFTDAETGTLPSVAFIDLSQHEHPSLDVRAGEREVAEVVRALRRSRNWKDSILFITYDESGGFYDHAAPPVAESPDGIPSGECADASDPPGSEIPGNGLNCADSHDAQEELCALAEPGEACANFDQLGFRVPLIAVSPFSKRHYVSHVDVDHTALLKLIEERFLSGTSLTTRDANSNTLDDMFDFNRAPSRHARVPLDIAPKPKPNDPGCQ